MYQINIKNGYIVSIVDGASNGNITEKEYNNLLDIIRQKPKAESGFDYRLKTNLTWELNELPEPNDEEATTEDYEAALAELGVK